MFKKTFCTRRIVYEFVQRASRVSLLPGGDQQSRYSGEITSPTWLGKPDEDEHMKMSEVEPRVD